MASLTNARKKAMIDTELASGAHAYIGYSINGTSEYSTAILARTAISALGGWTTPAAASTYAPANASAGDSAAAGTISGSVTITHYATFSAASGGTQGTDWISTTDPDAILITGGKVSHAAGAIVPVSAT
jgi:hypothetical protein